MNVLCAFQMHHVLLLYIHALASLHIIRYARYPTRGTEGHDVGVELEYGVWWI